MHLRLTTLALAAIALLLLAAVAVAPAMRVDLARSSVSIQVASTAAPADVALADILIGRFRPGFFPAFDGVVQGSPRADRVVWLRLQATLPTETPGRHWFVRIERAAVDRVAVLLPEQPEHELDESLFFRLGPWDARWPDGFVLALPEGLAGSVTIYVRVEGNVDVVLRPQLIDGAVLAEREAAVIRLFALVYGVLWVALTLCFLGIIRRKEAGGVGMVAVIVITALTIALVNDHLPLLLRAVLDPWLNEGLVYAITILLAGTLLLVARQHSRLAFNSATLALWYWRAGVGLLVVAALGATVPADHTDLLRRVAELVWSQTWLLVLVAFAMDRRRLNSVPIFLMVFLIAALVVRALAAVDIVPPSALALYGYQLLVAVLLLSLVLLPWMRGLPVEAPRRPVPMPELPVNERWAQAEATMVAAIDSALRYGHSNEADWVVARRLIDTLRPLLEARSVAMVRSGLHGEDRVLAEPASATDTYSRLLGARARVLRSLLRIGAPQQLVLPRVDGVSSQIALVPYLLTDSTWAAVFIEREDRGFDAEELQRIAMLATAARRVADKASGAREAALRADLDPMLDVLHAGALHRDLRKAFERCRDSDESISLLRLSLNSKGGFEMRAKTVIEALQALEPLPSFLLGRFGPSELWLVLPGLDVPAARAFAERLQRRLSRVETLAGWIIGIGANVPGERVPKPLIERAGEALGRASVPGAAAIQAIVPVRY